MVEIVPLRRRNRLAAMRMVQAAAVSMFEGDGFEATTVDDIAAATGVSASTIYRHFGTKEALVLWEERDEVVESELTQRLSTQPPVEAFRDAMGVAFGEREDNDLFLRRLRLTYREPALWSAAAHQDRQDRNKLAEAFATAQGRSTPTLVDTLEASLCLTALDVALERWQHDPTAGPLAAVIAEAVGHLR